MKFVKILVLLGVIAGAIYVASMVSEGDSSSTNKPATQQKGEGGPMLEERYGFTSQTVGQ